MTTITYAGKITLGDWRSYDDNDDTLHVAGTCLPEQIERDMEMHGRYLRVRFAIADQPVTIDDAQLHVMAMLDGLEQDGMAYEEHDGWGPNQAVMYFRAFSEITGYLWSETSLKVGGHDLDHIFRQYVGRYLVLEITYSKSLPASAA